MKLKDERGNLNFDVIFRKVLAIIITLGVFSVGIIGGHTIFMASVNAVLTWLVANYLLEKRHFGD